MYGIVKGFLDLFVFQIAHTTLTRSNKIISEYQYVLVFVCGTKNFISYLDSCIHEVGF